MGGGGGGQVPSRYCAGVTLVKGIGNKIFIVLFERTFKIIYKSLLQIFHILLDF